MATGDDDGFIGRWARRKAVSKGGLQRKETVEVPVGGRMITEPLPAAVEDSDGSNGDTSELARVAPDVPLFDDATSDLPVADDGAAEDAEADVEDLEAINIEALDFDADFTRFMKPGVPEALRQRALQRLWRTNPILANVDGLNDYDEDYSDAALVVDVLKSSYKVGQGYLTDDEAAERDAALVEDVDQPEEAVMAEDDASVATSEAEGDAEPDETVAAVDERENEPMPERA